MLDLLYDIIFMPIEILVEITYTVMHGLLKNPGYAIIAVSLVIQTLILPLYKKSDAMQDEERARQASMEKWVSHIKKTFSGDEKYMMLSAYYREQGYKSWYAVKSSASILLQIPFFVAAYRYLSNLRELSGESFWFIRDLSKPDMAISLSGFTINVLPILMTLINILSGIIYTKDLKFREKAQVYGLAAAFLVLLYNSPSGLVLYWTMNNLYSLLKNIAFKIIGLPEKTVEKEENSSAGFMGIKAKTAYSIFLSAAAFVAVFVGALIPMNVVKSSASEFVNIYHGPIYLVLANFCIYCGIFILWGSVFFVFMRNRTRAIVCFAMISFASIAVADYLVFGNKFGTMSPLFEYDNGLSYSGSEKLISVILIALICAGVALLLFRKVEIIKPALQILTLSAVVFVVVGGVNTQLQTRSYDETMQETVLEKESVFNLSKKGKNVVVIMLDRAISGYIPYVFSEKPEIADSYRGFTYYPNTISYGWKTNYGSPALFGGYEYSPKAMNERDDIRLKDKHNEALLLMPAIFSQNGYHVTVTDPPYAGSYNTINDLSIYDKYQNVEAYNLNGLYLNEYSDIFAESYQKCQEGRSFYYSLMRVMPAAVQKPMYHDGEYFSHRDVGVNLNFLANYSTLLKLTDITEVTDDDADNCIIMQNCSTHDVAALSVPEYMPAVGARDDVDGLVDYYKNTFAEVSDEISLTNITQIAHYQSNVASLMALGAWFDYIKANGCWDNTRIIIVADHGYALGDLKKDMISDDLDIEAYNPLLMVKDFGSNEFTESGEFMTNADVPSLAMEGLIDDPINPFTGNAVNADAKKDKQYVTTSENYSPAVNNGNVFDSSDGFWYEVTPGNIFDLKNWSKSDE